jgi:hypothetical protein
MSLAMSEHERRVTIGRQMQRYGGRAVLTTPKAEKVRTITMPALVAVELRRHLRDHVGEGILFRGLRGAEMLRRDQFYSSAWRPALRAAGLAEDSFMFHACRDWCASTLLAEGAPITAVAGHLGRHRGDCQPRLRALAPGRSGRAGRRSRPGARTWGRATGA